MNRMQKSVDINVQYLQELTTNESENFKFITSKLIYTLVPNSYTLYITYCKT